MSTDVTVDITITFNEGKIDELQSKQCDYNCNSLEKLLKMYVTKSTNNMHMFDENEKLKKYDNVVDIIDHYINVRKRCILKERNINSKF